MTVRRSLPELFLKAVHNRSPLPFLLWRDADEVVALSRDEALSRVVAIASGLKRLGIAPGDRIGILAPSSPEWLLFDLACLCAGAVTVPMFSNLSPDNLAWEIGDCAPKMILVQDQAQRLQIAPLVSKDVAFCSVERVDGLPSLQELAKESVPDPSTWLENAEESIDPSRPATIIYTSGSTGRPKGVVLSHAAICFQVQAAQRRYPSDPRSDLGLSCLPMAHIFERMVAYFHLANGYPLAISRDVQKVGEDLKLFRPTIMAVVPRLLEKMIGKIEAGVESAPFPKKWIGKMALHEARQPSRLFSTFAASLFEPLAWSKIRAGLGGRLRLVVSGGAPLFPSVETTLNRIGIPVFQGYGMTETSPVIAANFPGANKVGSVGLPFPGIEVRIADDDEVLVRGPSLLSGFWNDPDGRSKVFTDDGWFMTGDLGRLDPEGFLFLTGRKKDLCKSAGGKYVAPAPIEDAVSQHAWIEHAVVCADDRKFVSVLLSVNAVAIREHLARSGSILAVSDFVASPVFHAEIERHVQRVNEGLNEWEMVRRWLVSPTPFAIDTGELTPTLKVRRAVVLARHGDRLDALYAKK